MVVHVTLHTVLQEQPDGARRVHLDVTLPHGTTVGELYRQLGLRHPLEEVLLVVNRAIMPAHTALANDDRVDFIPALSGGTQKRGTIEAHGRK